VAAAGLTPTYDIVGSHLPTGDHRGATIDYVMLRPAAAFTVVEQTTTEVNADHDLLSAVVTIPARTTGERPFSFSPGVNVNDPASSLQASRAAALRTLRAAARRTPARATLRVATTSLAQSGVARVLRQAHRRGVKVRVVSGNVRTAATPAERALVAALGTSRSKRSWIVFRPGRISATSPTVLMAGKTGASRSVLMRASRPLDPTIVSQESRTSTFTDSTMFRESVRWFTTAAKR
jgi:hypothetical protein